MGFAGWPEVVCKCGGHPVYIPPADVHPRARTHSGRDGGGREERGVRTLRGVFVIVMPREDIAFHARFQVKSTYGRPTWNEWDLRKARAFLSPARVHLRVNIRRNRSGVLSVAGIIGTRESNRRGKLLDAWETETVWEFEGIAYNSDWKWRWSLNVTEMCAWPGDPDAHTQSERIVVGLEGKILKIEMDQSFALTGNIVDTDDSFHFEKEIKLVRRALKISVYH